MTKNHLFTNVTAILCLFVVLSLGGNIAQAQTIQLDHRPVSVFEQNPDINIGPVYIPADANVKSDKLTDNLKKVFDIGNEVGNAETLQAILIQESGGGVAPAIGNPKGPISKRSYGIMQVQTVAARSILSREDGLLSRYFPDRTYASLKDNEIINLLLHDDDANIRIAAYHFKLYLELCKGNWSRAVAAWNVGIGGVTHIPSPAKYGYVVNIKSKLEHTIRPFNRLNNLELSDGN